MPTDGTLRAEAVGTMVRAAERNVRDERLDTMTVITSSTDLDDATPEDPVSRERTRLAYAVHDGLTQVVTASVLELEWLARRVEREPTEATEALDRAAAELRKALDEIRDVLSTLTPETPSGADRLDDVVRGVIERWQLPATWSVEGDLGQVPGPVLEAASAVIRESVANAAKHAGTRDVSVQVTATEDVIHVLVEDHGRGFRLAGSNLRDGHLGLEMMRRRVAEQSGSLEIESSPGNGTRVVARLPVRDQGVTP
ncbi:MAG TPA: histidine kinase [Actinomycetota bacterium]|nr:histidine kinase [Actinomycetota bacterium]